MASKITLDLTPLDFFNWGVMKNNVYTRKIKNLDHLKAVIVTEWQKINDDPSLLRKVCYSVTTRVEQYIAADGRAFEKYR